jgi:hypothetical protein
MIDTLNWIFSSCTHYFGVLFLIMALSPSVHIKNLVKKNDE